MTAISKGLRKAKTAWHGVERINPCKLQNRVTSSKCLTILMHINILPCEAIKVEERLVRMYITFPHSGKD